MFVLLIVINSGLRSQTIDTLCFPISTIQNVLIAAKQKKSLDTLVIALNADIRSYQSVVKTLQDKDSVNRQIINTYGQMVGTMTEQRKIFEGQITYLNKEVKKWKRKTTLTAIGGVLLTGITTFLLLTR